MRSLQILIVLFYLFSSCARFGTNPEITVDEMSEHVAFLASDSLKGRHPGTPEDLVAARYITDQFKKAGLQWITEEGLQTYDIVTSIEAGDSNIMIIDGDHCAFGKEFTPVSFSSNKSVKAEVFFCGNQLLFLIFTAMTGIRQCW